jgi:hypothetical protein
MFQSIIGRIGLRFQIPGYSGAPQGAGRRDEVKSKVRLEVSMVISLHR